MFLYNGVIVPLCLLSTLTAVEAMFHSKLLDASKVPLTALTTPGNFYFLEFPVNENDSKLNPICADGTPYSFAFRRGKDEHVSKFLIEFEGGPACWESGSGSSCCHIMNSNGKKQVPWLDYLSFFRDQVVFQKTFPELGSCKGVPSGFVSEGAEFILSDNNGISGFIAGDVPISLRRDKGWWETLGGEGSDIGDWSYILLPHCSMDWHLGHKKFPQIITGCDNDDSEKIDAVYHRGGTNVDAVMNWIHKQFPSGLDALVTTAGGQIGGCSDDMGPAVVSSIGPAILAANLVKSKTDETIPPTSLSSTLVVIEGSGMWNPDLPSPEIMSSRWNAIDLPQGGGLPEAMDALVESSIEKTQFIWMTSNEGTASDEEDLWFMKQANNHKKFHVFEPTELGLELGGNKTEVEWCPLYTFPDADADVAEFFSDVIKGMSWSSGSSLSSSSTVPNMALSLSGEASGGAGNSRTRLSFVSIFIMLGSMVILAWTMYYIKKRDNVKKGENAPLSPSDLWFIALTEYPVAFLVISLVIPITLSCIGFSLTSPRINMDFDSYLQVNTDLENVKRNFDTARENQQASLEIEQANCNLYGNSVFGQRKLSDERDFGDRINQEFLSAEDSMFGNQELLDGLGLDIEIDQKIPFDTLSPHHRELSLKNLNYFSGGEWISVMYTNREGGNIFEPNVLKAIHEFESSIYDFPGFQKYCYGLSRCVPIDSLISRFFNNGQLVENIDSVVRSFLTDRPALWKLDQYFGPDNLGSNVTRSFVFLRNVGGDQSATHPFLRSFYKDFFVKHDRERTYPEFVHTWNNFIMKTAEADDALFHDTLWALGSLFFVSLMILLKVQSLFIVFFSMLGMVLAFSVSYYWLTVHFFIKDITLIWIAGLFVMLGIAADDIFLMVDSFDHTKHEFEEIASDRVIDIDSGNSNPDDREDRDARIEILRKRIKKAYSKAGSMMLVSSVTTAVCFFSNGFGVLSVIQEFGIFMGMVVLINYIHVMTILPSSILVNEIYVSSVQERFVTWCKSKLLSNTLNNKHKGDRSVGSSSQSEDVDAEKCLQNDTQGRGEKSKNVVEKVSNMNRTDRYLIETYAPFVTKRSYYLLCSTIILAIVLGLCGAMKFAMNDGSIVLYSSRYNLGRLETITDRYYSDGEDVYTTIEENIVTTFPPNPAPTPVPAPTFTSAPTPYDGTILTNVTVNWLNPEEAVAKDLPGALSPEEVAAMGDTMGDSNSGSSSGNSNPGSSNGNSNSGSSSYTTASGKSSFQSSSGSLLQSVASTSMRRRETIHVKLIWGVGSGAKDSSLWVTNKVKKSTEFENEEPSSSLLDLTEPRTQEWLLKVVEMAKSKPELFVRQDKITWIERLRDFAAYANVEFPIPKHLFTTYVELLKYKDTAFRDLIEESIGTSAPGLGGDFTFASITMMVDAVEVGNVAQANGRAMSEDVYREWMEFAVEANELSPSDVPPVVAQSSIFLDAYRVEAMYNSTILTWFVANGLCLLVIILFIKNLALSFMVMVTITLILLCLGGFLFAIYRIPFGPVEALGVSIFIGLSANYSLHVVHAYHHSRSSNRDKKIKEAIFAVGSPIVASALSTMGASAFLFGCRTWVFIELGILICSITGMALLYTMTFLFAWLSITGPLPINPHGHDLLHRWDLKVMCWDILQRGKVIPEQIEDDDSVFSIEVVEDLEEDSAIPGKLETKNSEIELEDDDSVYSIEVVDDLEEDSQKSENQTEEEGTQESEKQIEEEDSQESEKQIETEITKDKDDECKRFIKVLQKEDEKEVIN